MIQTGFGDGSPVVTDFTFTENGNHMFACMFQEGSYTGSTLSATQSGTNILDARDAVVVLPYHPSSSATSTN
jgi:hypothetical protein